MDESCHDVCKQYSQEVQKEYVCNQNQLQFLNSCPYLEKYFPCENGCWNEVGQDLPAYVNNPDSKSHQFCLFSMDVQPLCDFSVEGTERLCLCTKASLLPPINQQIRTPILKESRMQIKQKKIKAKV